LQFDLFYTGSPSAIERQQRATYSYYDDLVRLSGGRVLIVQNAHIGKAVDAMDVGSIPLKVKTILFVAVETRDNNNTGFCQRINVVSYFENGRLRQIPPGLRLEKIGVWQSSIL
jgi:hypothetical protein